MDKEGNYWSGTIVGDKKGFVGKFPPDFVGPVDGAKKADQSEDDRKKSSGTLTDFVRGKVSKKKIRFQQDGFDLDLTYITNALIAMGFPSESLAGVYRNNMKDVQRFFNTRHPKKYHLFNLCSERGYEIGNFEGRVSRYPFDDHNPCALDVIEPFCKDVKMWLDKDPENVVGIHCKAGKGRTGMLIACYLLYSEFSPNSQHALRYFACKRTRNAKGVTIPSQIRYVGYWDKILQRQRENKPIPDRNPLLIQSITLYSIPKAVRANNVDIYFQLTTKDSNYSSKGQITPVRQLGSDLILFQSDSSTGIASVDQDVFCTFAYHNLTKVKMFQFWFNTRMLEADASSGKSDYQTYRLILKKSELDKALKDKKHKLYSDQMRVELVFISA